MAQEIIDEVEKEPEAKYKGISWKKIEEQIDNDIKKEVQDLYAHK